MRKLRLWVALVGLTISLMVASSDNWLARERQDTRGHGASVAMVVPAAEHTTGQQATSRDQRDNILAGTSHQPLVSVVSDATYGKEVLQARVKTPVLIWFNRPERAGVFQADVRTMEMVAALWASDKFKVKVVRVDTAKLKKGGPIDKEFGAASSVAMTFTITQDSGAAGDTHHHDVYIMHPNTPLDVSRHAQEELLNFKPDCPRSKCPSCMGEPVWGIRPLAWR